MTSRTVTPPAPVLVVREYRGGRALCICGCGEVVRLAKKTARGIGKGRPVHYVSAGHQARRDAVTRFWEKFEEDPETHCWIWRANRHPQGYGMLGVDGEKQLAHRFAYELLVGPIPDGLQIDHLCRNRLCVNPGHLEPVTPAENTRRGFSPMAINGRKTHCKNGHPLSGENLYRHPAGGRQCRTCKQQYKLRWDAARKVVQR